MTAPRDIPIPAPWPLHAAELASARHQLQPRDLARIAADVRAWPRADAPSWARDLVDANRHQVQR